MSLCNIAACRSAVSVYGERPCGNHCIYEELPMASPHYVYRWNRMGRKGQTCTVLARGTMNSCLVEFEDGYLAVTSRNALRRRDAIPRK